MAHAFKPLTFHTLETSATYFRPTQELPEQVRETDPALDVMTDLTQVTLFTAELTTALDKALETMIKRGVRMLLVRDTDGHVKGLITSRDISGERVDTIMEKTGATREDLMVCDVMTLKGRLDVLMMAEVERATVGDIIETLRQVDRQHAMVVDTHPKSGQLAVRGIFSLSQIAVQLGLEIDPAENPTTFETFDQARQSP